MACLLGLSSPGAVVAQFEPLIRNHVPPAWQAENVRWSRDVQPRNKVDDAIDASLDEKFDVVVNFKRCVTDNDIVMLNGPAGQNRVQMRLKYLASVAVGGLTRAEIRELAALPDIAFIEQQFGFSSALNVSLPNICVTAGPCSPNTVQEAFPAINGAGVNIAIIDTGVDNTLHPTFAGAFVAGYDATASPPAFGDPDDDVFHGTHVASIALGRGGAGASRGVAPGAGLIDVKVIAAGDLCGTPGVWCHIVDGLQTVYDQHAAWNVRVINMSLQQCNAAGFIPSDGKDAFSQLVDLAESMGIVVVAAASNNGPGNSGLPTPAAATRAITVAASQTANTATRADDVLACFSSRGPRGNDGDSDSLDELKPEVTAPGTHVFNAFCTAQITGIAAARFNSTSGTLQSSGTSMAAPHVAGVAALILQARPGVNAASVKDLIVSTATPMGGASLPGVDPVWNNGWGWGLINAFAALNVAQQTDLTYPSYPPPVSWLSPDISISPDPAHVGVPTTVTVLIQNRGPAPANNVRVHFGVHVFSAATPTFHDIGTRIVNVPVHAPGASMPVSIAWTPENASHQCMKVEIGYGPDTDYSNNSAQRNLNVQMSPVTFEVRNTFSDQPARIQLVATQTGEGADWNLALEPREIVLGAMDCPLPVRAELFPGPNVPAGAQRMAHIAAVVQTPFGPVELGGVSFKATKPLRPDIIRQPKDARVPCGSTVTFEVAATGTEPLSYQWRFNGVDLPGAVGPTLTLANVGLAQAGSYSVVVSNPAGSATSAAAALAVLDGPAPRLSISRQGTSALITWPQTCASYGLEETRSLSPSTRWLSSDATVDLANGRYVANVALTSFNRFFRLVRLGTNEISFQPPPLPFIPFDDLDLTRPPTPVDARDIVEVPWIEIPGSLTDTLEARLRQIALQTPIVRELLGTRFAFLSASQAEPAKEQPGTNDITHLFYFSHDRNIAVQVIMRGTQFSDVIRLSGEQPPEGADEVAAAVDLARRDPRLRDRVPGLAGDAIVQVIQRQTEAGFGHRVLYVTFSRGDLEEMPLFTALVDLTTQEVLSVKEHSP